MKIRRRPERWRLRLENSNLPVESLFPLFQRGNRLREQAVRGLKFFFQAPTGFFCFHKRNGVVILINSIKKNPSVCFADTSLQAREAFPTGNLVIPLSSKPLVLPPSPLGRLPFGKAKKQHKYQKNSVFPIDKGLLSRYNIQDKEAERTVLAVRSANQARQRFEKTDGGIMRPLDFFVRVRCFFCKEK